MSDNLNLRRGRRLTDDEWLRAQDERWRAELREILRRPAPWVKGEKWGAHVGVLLALIVVVPALVALVAWMIGAQT